MRTRPVLSVPALLLGPQGKRTQSAGGGPTYPVSQPAAQSTHTPRLTYTAMLLWCPIFSLRCASGLLNAITGHSREDFPGKPRGLRCSLRGMCSRFWPAPPCPRTKGTKSHGSDSRSCVHLAFRYRAGARATTSAVISRSIFLPLQGANHPTS
jgi:hypothetical protein